MRRFVFIGLGIITGTGLILASWAHFAIAAKWSRLEERVRELETEIASTPPGSGKAWEHYQAALSFVRNSPFNMSLEDPLPEGEALLKLRTSIEALAPALESLRAGAQLDGARPAQVEFGVECELLGRGAVLQARVWRQEGRLREAADLVLSAATYARDASDEGAGFEIARGLKILDDAWEELRLLIAEKKLSEADGDEIARRMEALDRRFPRAERSMHFTVLHYARQLLKDSPKFEYITGSHTLRAGPGSLFSVRLLKARAFERWEHYLDRFRGVDTMPWTEIDRISTEIVNEIRGDDAQVLQLPLLHLGDDLGTVRESLAQLRLLRMALAFRRAGTGIPLADPFGGTIMAKVSGPSLQAWSKGMGASDGSKSGWKRAVEMMDALNRGAILIEATK